MSDVIPDRDLRQRALVPPERLAECRATVVGVGAIGRQVALQLAAMGVPRLQLVDHDVVEPANLACQGYLQDDLGRPKVQATADLCHRINPLLDPQSLAQRFRRSMEVGNVLFCCVDSIETRRLIWEAVKGRVEFFADGRMSAETIRVLAACDSRGRQHYPSTLFAAVEAHPEPCTAKSKIYTANVAAENSDRARATLLLTYRVTPGRGVLSMAQEFPTQGVNHMDFWRTVLDVLFGWLRPPQGVRDHQRRQAYGPRWSQHRPRRIGRYTRRRPRRRWL